MREAHQLDEVEELRRRPLEADAAAPPLRGKLQPGERVDADGVRLDPADVAARDAARRQDRADALAETGEVGSADGAADPEGDLVRP